MQPVETLVVGGGPAGLATALFLVAARPSAMDGLVVLEKARYPRDKPCAGAIGARGDRLLASIGVRIEVPSVPLAGLAFRAFGETRILRQAGLGRVVRRLQFDHALARAARGRGIRILEGVTVHGVRQRASGVEVETSQGGFRADRVVGADGVGSVVRRSLGLPRAPFHAQAVEVDTERLVGDFPSDVLGFDVSESRMPGYAWDFPTLVDQRPLMSRGVYALTRGGGRRAPDVGALLDARLRALGLDPSRYRQRRYAERGYARHSRLAEGAVLLVGEAAGIDPVTGEGIAQALHYGATAGAYLAGKLARGDRCLDDWPRAVRGSSVGRDLLVRSLAAPLFYGPGRARVERFLLDTPAFLQVGLAHFSGRSWPRRDVARALGAAAVAVARGAFAFPGRPGY